MKKRRGAEGEIDGGREEVVPTEAVKDDPPPLDFPLFLGPNWSYRGSRGKKCRSGMQMTLWATLENRDAFSLLVFAKHLATFFIDVYFNDANKFSY